MKTTHLFENQTNRYAFDFNFCTTEKGYAQVDTYQDAVYFGTWANPLQRKIINYAEGDITIDHCESDDEFISALQAIHDWNKEQGSTMKIDPGFNPALKQAFINIGAGRFLYPAIAKTP